MEKPVLSYVRAADGEIEKKQQAIREFATQHGLSIYEEYACQSSPVNAQ